MIVMGKKVQKFCCDAFEKVTEPRSDNEGYGRLIWIDETDVSIGCDLPTIDYCPWCGYEIHSLAARR